MAVQRSGHLQHGEADGAVAALHDGCGGAVPAGPDGQAADSYCPTRGGVRSRTGGRSWRAGAQDRRTAGARNGRSVTTMFGSGLVLSRASLALDNLRGFVILLVLSFHSVLAYLNFLPSSPFPFDAPPYLWRAFPIVDTARWFGFDLFCAWQDVFLMTLFFFLSGL